MKLMPIRCFLLLIVTFISGCSGSGLSTSNTTSEERVLALSFVSSPIELSGIATRFAGDVPYDADGLNTFDIFLPDVTQATGLIIYVHGGGFTSGDKSAIYQDDMADNIRDSLSRGVAFASINYRLLSTADSEGVMKPLSDSRRALQFMRYHANALNIDPSRIAMYGESAGAGTSLWLAYHDDMADADSVDPVSRQSTRISAVGAIETQATYDITRWESDVFVDYGITISGLQTLSPILSQRLLSFYGASSEEQLNTEAIAAYRADVDMLSLMSSDDPNTWLSNSEQPALPLLTAGVLFHHPFHAREIRDQANAMGLTNVSYIPELGIVDASGEDVISFLVRHIQ